MSEDYTIATDYEGNWIIISHDDGLPSLAACPCCEKPFRTKEAAQLVADHVFRTLEVPHER